MPSHSGASALSAITTALVLAGRASAASYSPSLNINDASDLQKATAQALTNLMTYYTPNSGGVFDQVQTPWHESGMIWGTYMDYAKWSGDTQFMNTVTHALANASYNSQQDFLGGDMVTYVETLLGRWNDDILWPSQAIVAGAEIYGMGTTMVGAGGPWFTAAQKTFDQAYEQWDNNCSGGIYWSRDRTSKGANYKSLITQLEFIQQGARNYVQSKNETALSLAEQAANWVLGASGLGNPTTGVLFDGMDITACSSPTQNQWSYNYGELIGAFSWMHKATGNQTWLDLTKPFLTQALATYAGSNTSGVVTEQCEPAGNCNRDQQGFKAILLRNMAYLYRETSDNNVKTSIKTAIDTSVASMVNQSCDAQWNCNGNWSLASVQPIKYVRSQHVSAALLVAAMGIHSDSTGSGLITAVNATALSNSSSGSSSSSSGSSSGSSSSNGKSAAERLNFPVVTAVGAALLGLSTLLL